MTNAFSPLVLVLAFAAGTVMAAPAPQPPSDMLRAYAVCDGTARVRPVTGDAGLACAAVYESLKLSFVPGMTTATFRALSAHDRAAVSREAYRGWSAWRAENAALWDAMTTAACDC